MFNHYLRFFFRRLQKNKVYSLINIVGLTLGLACAFFMIIYVSNELSYDKHHDKINNIYRVIEYAHQWDQKDPNCPLPLAHLIRENLPEIQYVTPMRLVWPAYINKNDEKLYMRRMFGATEDIFKIFSFEFAHRSEDKLLDDPYDLVISENMAEIMFGTDHPVGKKVDITIMGKLESFVVTGVFKNYPHFSSFSPEIICDISWPQQHLAEVFGEHELNNTLFNSFFSIYLLAHQGSNPEIIGSMINTIAKAFDDQRTEQVVFSLQPLSDIYLGSKELVNNHYHREGDQQAIRLFSLLAIVILFVATFNYIMLSLAKDMIRTKEIGLRKVFGASVKDVRKQTLMEALLQSFVAFLFGLLIIKLLLSSVSELFNQELMFSFSGNWELVLAFLIVAMITGFISGAYLAFYYSGLSPTAILQKRLSHLTKSITPIKMIIVIQLTIFIGLLVCAGIVFKQLSYFTKKDMGFDSDNLLILYLDDDLTKNYMALKVALQNNSYVEEFSGASFLPPSNHAMSYQVYNPDDPENPFVVEAMGVDFYFIETMGLQLLQGRSFSPEYISDEKKAVIINETAAKLMNLDNPVGEVINEKTIIGVVKDFNLHSLHTKIPPIVIDIGQYKYMGEVVIRYNPRFSRELKESLEKTIKDVTPESSFYYASFKDAAMSMYKKEKKLYEVLIAFTILAVFIAFIGLAGLTLYLIERKNKEISIRKVHGASFMNLTALLSRQFLFPALIAIILAWVTAYFLMDYWLSTFAYHTNMGVGVFILSVLITVVFIQLVILIHSVKISRNDPVKTLYQE